MRQTLNLIRAELLLAHAWSRGLLVLGGVLLLATGVAIGHLGRRAEVKQEVVGSRTAAAGPWGELLVTPIAISCPAELLPVQAFEKRTTRWFFKGYTNDTLLPFLTECGLQGDLREKFRGPEVWHEVAGGIEITPTPDIVLNLEPKARRAIYSLLAGFPENSTSLIFVLARTADERFAASGVRPETVGTFKRLSCEYGRYFVFSDVASIFAIIPTYAERVAFLKALTWQPTLLVRLKVDATSDLASLAAYWGKAGRARDERPLLESLARVPGGAQLDLVNLLPPGPMSRLYSFPIPTNPTPGQPAVRQDCHWSAFNFFRDVGAEQPATSAFILEKLRSEYFPVVSDQRYGDIVTFVTPDDSIIHSAVYIADNIVFTKNGDTQMHPWMLSTVEDLLDQYSFQVAPSQRLEVRYFRNKYF